MRRFVIKSLALCLAIAALVQIAIVAASARWGRPSVTQYSFPPRRDHVLSLCHAFVAPDVVDQTAPVIVRRTFGRDWMHVPRDSAADSFDMITIHRIGWPCRVVAGEYWHYEGLGHLRDELVDLRPILVPREGVRTRSYLPTSPLWAGLGVNLLVFAAAAWIVVFGPFRARGVIRQRGRRCVGCGYRMTGDRCSECGRAGGRAG